MAVKTSRRPGRPTSGTGRKADRRAKILDVAEHAFAEKGYAPTSLRAIAAQAAVNPALITYYFGSKEKLGQNRQENVADSTIDTTGPEASSRAEIRPSLC